MTTELQDRLAKLSPEKRALYELRLKKMAEQKSKPPGQTIPARDGDGPWPASLDQTALWFFHQIDPNTTAYNLGVGQIVRGPIQIPVLERALNDMAMRHEILRTTFYDQDGKLYQRIAPSSALKIPVHDVRHLAKSERLAHVEREIPRLVTVPFDLEKGPMVRLPLFRLDEEEYVMVANLHHAVTDWWSYKLFFREIMVTYLALVQDKPAPLPELPIQFADYALYRNRWLESEAFEQQRTYWLNKLNGAPFVLEVPADRPRPPVQSYGGARAYYNGLSHELLDGIRGLNRKHNATSLMTTLAGTFAFLYRYAGVDDLLIGTSTAGREYKEIENMIGFVLNVLVLRARLRHPDTGRSLTFNELVAQVRQTVLEAFANKEVPFRYLVEKLHPERDLSRMPIYQVDFNHVATDGPVFHDYRGMDNSLRLPGYEVEKLDVNRGVSDVDLQFDFDETLHGLNLVIEYNTDIFEKPTIDHMSSLMVRLLTNMCLNPDVPIDRLAWLSEEQRRDLLTTWNGLDLDFPRAATVHALVEDRVRQSPDAPAIHDGEVTIAYAELNERANRIAHHLIEQGVADNAPVGLCLEPGVDWAAAMLGVLKAGGAYVPIDPNYPHERISYMLGDTGMAVLITVSSMMDVLPAYELNFLNVLVLDEDQASLEAFSVENPAVRVEADDLAYIIYTSGTTGRPKGVQVTHRNINRLVFDVNYLSPAPGDGIGQASNASFDAHVFEVWTALIHGGRVCIIDKDTFLDAELLAAQIQAQRIEILFMTTALFNQHVRNRPGIFGGMKTILFGGERVDPESVRTALERGAPQNLLHVYGPTETTTFASWFRIEEVAEDAHNIPIGGPIANTRIYLLDPSSELAPVGVVGELCIGGDGLARGYLNAPALTAQRFTPDPFSDHGGQRIYRTGDLVKRLPGGPIEFHGRRDHQVKVRGFRIELQEIETALTEHESVAEAVAITREDQPGARRILAYVRPASGQEKPSESALRAYLQEKLPDYMLPAALILLETFPLTPNGKIDAKKLPDPEHDSDRESYVAPRNQTERALAGLWADTLSLARVGVHDNFFELGGDSILGIQVIAAANRMGLSLSTKQLFQNQTIAELAEKVGAAQTVHAEQGAVTGPVPLTPIQSWFLNKGRKCPHHFNISVILNPRRRLRVEILAQTLKVLAEQHDSLRLRFTEVDGVWSQHLEAADGDHFVLAHHDLSAEPNPIETLETMTDATQQTLDLTNGPVARAILFGLPDNEQRLFIVIHHLVVDGISWRILSQDLETVYTALEQDRPPGLMPKTTSWKYWSERLTRHAASEPLLAELEFWRAESQRPSAFIAEDHPNASRAGATTKTVITTLDREQTRALLQDTPPVYNTRINDVLLTALALATAEETGEFSVRIALEGHGREELFEDVDFSRTLGWFTAMYPVVLDLGGAKPPGEALKIVKEQLRRIPNNGIGYGLLRHVNPETGAALADMAHPQLNFNYLGQTDGGGAQDGLFRFSTEAMGREHTPDDDRGHLFEIVGLVIDGKMNLVWNYSGAIMDHARVEKLADRNYRALLGLIDHCLAPGSGGRTPSDFPHVSLSQSQVDLLLEHYPDLEAVYPASPMQQGMLLHSEMATGSSAYMEQLSMRIRGPLRLNLLREAWQRATDRHPAARTLFRQDRESSLQIVKRRHQLEWREIDANGDEPAVFLQRDLDEHFESTRSVPSRVTIVHRGHEDAHFIWTFHHALLDGWSVPILMDETARIYMALSQGLEPELPPIQDYTRYMTWLAGIDRDEAAAYWRELLHGFERANALAPEPSEESRFAHWDRSMDSEQSARLNECARVHGLTASTLIQGAWAVLLARYSGSDDVVFGITVSGRPPELDGMDRMTGLFINTLPLRTQTKPALTTLPWLKSVQEQQAASRQYEQTPLSEIQRYASLEPGQALFQSIIVFENFPVDDSLRAGWAGMTVEDVHIFEQANYPISIQAAPGDRIGLRFGYDATLFSPSRIEQIHGHLVRLLLEIAEKPESRLGDLDMMSQPERERIMTSWNDTERDYPNDRCIHRLFEDQVKREPRAIALVYGEAAMRYAELNSRANRFARRLREMGVTPAANPNVAFCLPQDDPDTITVMLAILKAGGAYLPLDPNLPESRSRFMLEDAAIFLRKTDHGKPLSDLEIPRLEFEGDGSLLGYPDTDLGEDGDPLQTAYIMYTSGSTGQPKGVAIPHRGPVSLTVNANHARIEPGDAVLQASVHHFDASTFEIWGALLNGARLVLMNAADVERVPVLVREHGVTILHLTAQLFQLMLDTEEQSFADVRLVLTGGDRISAPHVEKFQNAFPGKALLNCYGPTETTTFATTCRMDGFAGGDPPIGSPVSGAKIRVLDQHDRLAPVGVQGRMFIEGEGLARGYWSRPDLTAAAFSPNPFSDRPGERMYATGDLASYADEGLLYFHGRADRQLKLRGFRIEPGEIENRLESLPDVTRALVLPVAMSAASRQLVAYLQTGHTDGLTESARAHLAKDLPDYMIPSTFIGMARLPIKPNGKIDLAALPHPDSGTGTKAFVAPATETETAIAAIWSELLGRTKIGVHDHFFELGAHSLLMARVVSHLREKLAVEVPIKALFEAPTVAALAEYIDVLRWSAPPEPDDDTSLEDEGEI